MWDLIVSVPDHCLSFYFAGVYFKEHFYAQLKIPLGTNVNFYQETGLFNVYLKTFYVYIFNFLKIKEAQKQ